VANSDFVDTTRQMMKNSVLLQANTSSMLQANP
jgi:hypothetical protein